MVAITSSDTGQGVDSSGFGSLPTNYGSGAYNGAFTYGSSLSYIAVHLSDSGSGVDGTGSIGTPITHVFSSDSGAGSHEGSIASVPGSATPLSQDTGHMVDVGFYEGSIYPASADSGSGAEGAPLVVYTGHFSGTDRGYGADTDQVMSGTSLVQSNSVNSGAPVSSQVITLPNGIGLGNLIVVCEGDNGNDPIITAPAGWTQAVLNAPNGLFETGIWYMIVTAATVGQTSWTFTCNTPLNVALSISEHNSIYGWLPFPVDQTAVGNFKPNTSASSTIDSGTTQLTAQTAELWVASLVWGGGSTYTSTEWNPITPALGSGLSLAELWTVTDAVGSADCNVSIGLVPYPWAGAVVTFMAVMPGFIVSQDSGSGSEAPSTVPALSTMLVADVDSGFGGEITGTAAPEPVHGVSVFDAGVGSDGSLSLYGTGVYGNGIYSVNEYVPVIILPTGAQSSSAASDYGTGQEKVNSVFGAPGPAISAASLRNLFEGFSLSRAAILGSTGAESGQLYGAQTISLVPNVTSTAMQEDDWDAGVWYSMDKAALTVTNGFMSWNTLSTLTGLTVASFGTSPSDYYGLPLWTQQQHNMAAVPMAFRMSSKNGLSATRTLDFLLYRVQLAVADFTGMVYKQGLGVSYAGTVLFSSVDEEGNALPYPQIGKFVSSPGTRTGAFTRSAYV